MQDLPALRENAVSAAVIRIPPTVEMLLHRLSAAGFAAYAVGGCVRDSLLGLQPQDWDICTSARPEQTAECFAAERTILTGAKYGTVTVLAANTPFEITTFRAESTYTDRRHPDAVSFLTELRGDLSRRDFTVNAMAAAADGAVIDLFGGQEDLQNRLIRCVGAPRERFSEDVLRILRGLRFASRLDFAVERETAAAIHECREMLSGAAPERLHKELSGLLCGRGVFRVLCEYPDVLCALIPELRRTVGFRQYHYNHAYDVYTHTAAVTAAVEPEERLRLAALLHDIAKPNEFFFDKNLVGHFYGHAVAGAAEAERILRRLRYDGGTVSAVAALVRAHDLDLSAMTERQMRRLLAKHGEEQTRALLRLRRADRLGKGTEPPSAPEEEAVRAEALLSRLVEGQACVRLPQMAISGRDLLALGVPQGPRIGALLETILQAVLEEKLPNEREALVEYAQELIDKTKND